MFIKIIISITVQTLYAKIFAHRAKIIKSCNPPNLSNLE